MLFPSLAILVGFVILVWSADLFISGAAATAHHMGMPALLIGMVIVGFGTSAPEMVVSAQAALDGNPDLALGNALGSNIVNTGMVLGVTALVAPIMVHSNIVRKELPILIMIGVLFGLFISDQALNRTESIALLAGFFALIGWTVYAAMRGQGDHLEFEINQELQNQRLSLKKAMLWILMGLILLIASSRILVWGAISVAELFGVSNLIIGLTVVALGTSLPELAASIMAVRKGEHDIAIGNVVGSNMFNLLAVAGIAGTISPMTTVATEVLTRDWPVMMALTLALLVIAYGFRRQGSIGRIEGAILLISYISYNIWLIINIVDSTVLP